jgi:hypothetical protein
MHSVMGCELVPCTSLLQQTKNGDLYVVFVQNMYHDIGGNSPKNPMLTGLIDMYWSFRSM